MIGGDTDNSVFAYLRCGAGEVAPVLAVCNMTPVPRPNYRIGVPQGGWWQEIVNTDSGFYGGSDMGNAGGRSAVAVPAHGEEQSLELLLPPLATVLMRPAG